MSKVTRAEQLKPAFELAVRSDPVVMAEQWIVGDEYTVSMLDGEALPAIRIEPEGDIYDYEAKYLSDNTQYHCPCGLSADDEAAMQQLAQEAFAALGCTGWGRVDLMRGEDGRNWLIEVNTNPGMTDHSLVPKAAKQAGYDFSQLVVRILETAL
ncbi:MAG: hypothetical protein CR976_01220 [Thiotrichales bacterium]|nr:MAG: hypothetical protein CR976_01220 [Thiotrichales bacterium]